MKAMILESLGEVTPSQPPLKLIQHPEPTLAPGEVLLRVGKAGEQESNGEDEFFH